MDDKVFIGYASALKSDGSIMVNKKMIRELGLNTAVIYSELLSKYMYFYEKNRLEDGWFFCTVEDLEHSTSCSVHVQQKSIKELESLGLLEVKRKGMPSKRYIKLTHNIEYLSEILSKKDEFYKQKENLSVSEKLTNKSENNCLTSEREIDDTVSEKVATNKIKIIRLNNNNKDNDKDRESNQSSVDNFNIISGKWKEITGQILDLKKHQSCMSNLLAEYDLEDILKAIERITKSDYLKEKIDFKWFTGKDNFLNVFNGKYDNYDIKPKESKPEQKSKFHNFPQATSGYSDDQLEKILRKGR